MPTCTPVGMIWPVAWVLFAATVVWALIYDTMYAMVDREDDKKIGIKSTAILFGEVDLFVIAGLQLLMLATLVFIGLLIGMSFAILYFVRELSAHAR